MSTNKTATQVIISQKDEKKGAKDIYDLTQQLSQVLKQFCGIYNKVLPSCKTRLTVEDWMNAHGVYRFVGKNGKKKDYTPALLMDGWHEGMKEGKRAFIFKNRKAVYKPTEEDVKEWGLKTHEHGFYVFTWEEANKLDGKPISRYDLAPIEDNRWSVRLITNGLMQKVNYANESAKHEESLSDWNALEHVYIVRFDKEKDGSIVRKIIEVKKNLVIF